MPGIKASSRISGLLRMSWRRWRKKWKLARLIWWDKYGRKTMPLPRKNTSFISSLKNSTELSTWFRTLRRPCRTKCSSGKKSSRAIKQPPKASRMTSRKRLQNCKRRKATSTSRSGSLNKNWRKKEAKLSESSMIRKFCRRTMTLFTKKWNSWNQLGKNIWNWRDSTKFWETKRPISKRLKKDKTEWKKPASKIWIRSTISSTKVQGKRFES